VAAVKRPAPSTTPDLPSAGTNRDLVLEAITQLQKQQVEQQHLLKQLMSSRIPDPEDNDFEASFNKFLAAYNKLPVEQRSQKIRKVVLNISSNNIERLSEIIDVCSSTNPSLSPIIHNTECTSCPHKQQLQEWDQLLYSEFFTNTSL